MRTSSYLGIASLLFWFGGFLSASSSAAFDAYLKIDGVDGESLEPRHTNWISILSFSANETGGTTATQAPGFSSLCFIKRVDKASPLLAQRCALGVFTPSVHLELIQTGGSDAKFYEITLEDVLIRSVAISGDAGSLSDRPGESFCLDFRKITWTYTQLTSSGIAMEDTSAWWDVALNKGETGTSPFRVTGNLNRSGEIQITWPALSGKTYNIMGRRILNGPVSVTQTFTAAADGPATQVFPTSSASMFFVVEQTSP